ncbi:hypothetical protein Hypma_000597 [Hypsizygus marmoreus]|uniref:Uncharacterized protein n=1 Tax=Hypsizygus marmoreus TaxID=39966 RepID=A0A369JAV9_HYPMA|nr:hypothetical protein Hypma_000597 [Hypsizygus marmoreus]
MAPTSANPANVSKRAPRKKTTETVSLEALAKLAKECVDKYNKVANTDKAYTGQITRAKQFVNNQVVQRKAAGVSICEQGIPTDELEKALDNPPNQYSAMAVEMFITQKCFTEGCGKQVAESIHAAFCRYWDTM